MYKNLSQYVELLESRGELLRVKELVSTRLEMAEIADRISKQPAGGKAILFENNGTDFPVLMNMMGSDARMCATLGVRNLDDVGKKLDDFFHTLMQPKKNLWDKLQLLPTLKQASTWLPRTSKSKGECQQVVICNPDLNTLPILQCWPHDGGRFVTLPMVHTRDLQTGMRNVGMYRMQVFDGQTTGMHWHRHKTGARHFEQYKAAGQKMPVAVALGGDPVYTYSATAPLPDNVDEYLLAGFLRGKPVQLVRCITQPIEVPADADIVIEGYVDPAEPLVVEGPFGDHTGFYSLEDYYPRFHVTCITHRKNAIYPATLVGIPPQEDAYIGKATERIFLAPIRIAMLPEIVDMHMPFEGVAHNIVVVKITKTYPGQGQKTANALWGAGQMMLNKMLVVVDEDVDLTDYAALCDCVLRNFNPATDVYFGQGPLDVLDHSAQACGFGGKMCIDATRKLPEERAYCHAERVEASQVGTSSPQGTDLQHEILRGAQGDSAHSNLYQLTHSFTSNKNCLIQVLFDENVNLNDVSTCMWLMGNNVDPARDCRVENGILMVDATSKRKGENGFTRDWPNVVCASAETIKAVDEKWSSLGLGDFISSPSLRYKELQRGGGARVV